FLMSSSMQQFMFVPSLFQKLSQPKQQYYNEVREQLLGQYFVGDYLVTSYTLGKGSYGAVFRGSIIFPSVMTSQTGFHRRSGLPVAIKKLDFSKMPEETKRYLDQEVTLLKGNSSNSSGEALIVLDFRDSHVVGLLYSH